MEEANLQGPSDAPLPSTSNQHWVDDGQDGTTSRFVEAKSHVDTAAPIDSVKGAVTKFGGILDWKEKRKHSQDDGSDKVQEEAAEYQERWTAAQAGRAQALRELGSATREADKLRLSLKRSQIEEAQARHESDLAQSRLRDLQRGASADLHAARERRAAAIAELQAARAEVESLEKVRAAAAAEAGAAAARARKAAVEARESGKAVECLAAEIVALHADLESSRAAHVDAEEKRLRLALALEQDKSRWQMELEDAQQEAKRLRAQLMAACDVEMKAEAASQVLLVLKGDEAASSSWSSQACRLRKEMEGVRASVERAREEADCLCAAAASMRDELAREKAALAALRRREELSSASIPYLRAELAALTAEAAAMEAASAEESRMAQRVAEAAIEAEEAKAKARSAGEEVARAREEAGVAMAAAAAVEARLEAVAREIVAATASEEIAAASAAALVQQQESISKPPSPIEVEVTLAAAEYGELSRRARETEEAAGRRVMEAVRLIKEAKDAEVRMLERLAQQDRRTDQRRRALEAATLEAEEAEFAKLSAERELRQWRADHDHGLGLAEISVLHDRAAASDNPHILSPRGGYMMQPRTSTYSDAEARQRPKPTFFPRMVMFLARKRAQSWK